jgi:tRNA nucleotidyltransferase (CCA-adding enzyme)
MEVLLQELNIQYQYDQKTPYHRFDLWTHTRQVTAATPADNLDLRWAALLHDVAKPFCKATGKKGQAHYIGHDLMGSEMVWKIGKYLKFSNRRLQFVTEAVREHLREGAVLREFDEMGKK